MEISGKQADDYDKNHNYYRKIKQQESFLEGWDTKLNENLYGAFLHEESPHMEARIKLDMKIKQRP